MASEYESVDRENAGVLTDLLSRARRYEYTGVLVNAGPAAFWLGVFFLVPLGVMLVYSFGERGAFGEVLLGIENLGLQNYRTFFVPEEMSLLGTIVVTLGWFVEWVLPMQVDLVSGSPTSTVQLTIRSIWYGVVATLACLALGFPVAYYVARIVSEERRNLMLALIVLPYWASYLVRVYAIKLLLAKNGILPTMLTWLPFVDGQPQLLHNNFSVQFGLVYIWLPFMILPVYASLEQLDFTLHEAAMDLGADRLDAFLNVTLPLAAPGLIAGSILVFIPSVGAYVIPELLGGPSNVTIGRFIASQFGAAGNWPLGAAASFVLMAIMMGSIWVYLDKAGGEML